MKLNLLPTYVSRGRQIRFAVMISLIFLLGSIGGAVVMVQSSKADLETARAQEADFRTRADAVVRTAAVANTVMAPSAMLVKQVGLARAMDSHNSVYPEFYNRVFPYIPSFFRINTMGVVPNDGAMVTLTMTGVIKTQEQYADLMLALLRIPGATSVARQGFFAEFPQVPPLTENDQLGRPRKPSEPPMPRDPLERLQFMMSQGGVSAFSGAGRFGTDQGGIRGAMPNYSEITVSVVLPGNLLTPNPRASLAGVPAAAAAIRPAGG